jgi:signal transduction histidine kinase/ActR/RegA family two-component response regulator
MADALAARDKAQRQAEEKLRQLNATLEDRVIERTNELTNANQLLKQEITERERAQAELMHAQKIEAIGQLTSGIAHDFNNLLTAILGSLTIARRRAQDEKTAKALDTALRAGRRGAKLVRDLLAFSRRQRLDLQSIQVNEVLAGTEELLERTLGSMVRVEMSQEKALWRAMTDPGQLELAVLNLAINARDAMPLGGRLVIETRNISAAAVDKSLDLAPGDYVLVAVADTGIGMSPEVLARACEPFFTTKEPGKGSGLGLAQVYGVARQSGGCMRLRSAVGKGTRVELYLPRSFEQAETAEDAADQNKPAVFGSKTRVLIVDDHEDVREVIVAYLETLGYDVVQASSGRTALDFLDENSRAVDLLIADYAMPEMSGLELVRAVRAQNPTLPVVIVTGYAETGDFDDRRLDAVLLKKPFRMNELGATIEAALARRNEADAMKVVPLRIRKRS